jgi:hypothetical protein
MQGTPLCCNDKVYQLLGVQTLLSARYGRHSCAGGTMARENYNDSGVLCCVGYQLIVPSCVLCCPSRSVGRWREAERGRAFQWHLLEAVCSVCVLCDCGFHSVGLTLSHPAGPAATIVTLIMCRELEYIQILSLWHQAQCILTDTYPCLPPLMFKSARIVLGVWSAALLGMYIAMPFPEVLLVASSVKLAICVVIFSAFMYYLATLRNIMKTAAMHPNCWAMCLYPKRNDALLNDMKEYNTWRARHKLARITRVCVLYAFCAVFRAVVMCYQLDEALTGFEHGASQGTWFGIVFSNYLVTEIIVAALVLLIVRKPARAKRSQGYTVIEGDT